MGLLQVVLVPGEGEYSSYTLAVSLIIGAVEVQCIQRIAIALGVM